MIEFVEWALIRPRRYDSQLVDFMPVEVHFHHTGKTWESEAQYKISASPYAKGSPLWPIGHFSSLAKAKAAARRHLAHDRKMLGGTRQVEYKEITYSRAPGGYLKETTNRLLVGRQGR